MKTIMEDKTIIGTIALVCLTGLQFSAWYMGHDGLVFATTSAIFGAIIGSYFDIKDKLKAVVKK